MALTADQIAAAREWAMGKTGQEIADKASFYNLSQADVGSVFGVDANRVAQTGYGTPGGLNAETAGATYGGYQAPTPQQPPGTGTRSQGQDPYRYDTQNPYMAQMSNVIGQQVGENLARNVLPTVRADAQATGGYGGSRQGVVEANVLNDATKNIAQQLTGMYYGDYDKQLGRQMQQYQTDAQYDLGLGNLALGNLQANNSYNLGLGQLALGNKTADNTYSLGQGQLTLGNKTADNNYNLGLSQLTNQKDIATMQDKTNRYQADSSAAVGMAGASATSQAANNNYTVAMRNADIAEMRAAADIYNSMISGMGAAGQGLYNTGTAQQNSPWNTINQFSGAMNPFSGMGQTVQTGGGAAGALGGAFAGAQIGNLVGNQYDPMAIVNTPTTQNTPNYLLVR